MLSVVFTSRHKYVFSRCGIKNLHKSYAIQNVSLTLYKNRAHHTMRPTNLLK